MLGWGVGLVVRVCWCCPAVLYGTTQHQDGSPIPSHDTIRHDDIGETYGT